LYRKQAAPQSEVERDLLRQGGRMGEQKAHAVCIAYPAQGHINPTLKLAKILHARGFHITFVHTEFNRNRLLRTHGPTALDGLPSFRFETIPDGLPMTDADATQDILSLSRSIELNCLGPFLDLLRRLNRSGGPPVSCIVSDTTISFTVDAAGELGVQHISLWPASAASFLGVAQYEKLLQLGLVPFRGTTICSHHLYCRICSSSSVVKVGSQIFFFRKLNQENRG